MSPPANWSWQSLAVTAAEDSSDPVGEAVEATRIRGYAVPLVAAAVVLGIGGVLTALSLALVGRPDVSAKPAPSSASRARLAGAVNVEGTATNLGCLPGAPLILIVNDGSSGYSVLIGVPPSPVVGSYALEPGTGAFITVSKLGGEGLTWTSKGRERASGVVTIEADRSVSARFGGLGLIGPAFSGIVGGSVEARCA